MTRPAAPLPPSDAGLHELIESAGLYFDRSGLPATCGRILGHLLCCQPAVQSATELARALETTSGSISTNALLLEAGELIERVPVRGRRGVFYRVAPGAFSRLLVAKMDTIGDFRAILQQGLAAMGGANPGETARLRDALELYDFLEDEFPRLMERFEEQRRGS